jgi:hypothetical protein
VCLSLGVALTTYPPFLVEVGLKIVFHSSNQQIIITQLGFWFLGAFAKSRKATIGFVMSACLPVRMNNSAPTGRIFMKCYVRIFFENLSKKIQVSLKPETHKGYFT